MKFPELRFEGVSSQEIDDYAALSGDFNPVHQDDDFARNAGLKGRIVHGMLTMGLASTALEKWGFQTENALLFTAKFKDVLYPNEPLIARLDSVEELDDKTSLILWSMLKENSPSQPIISLEAKIEKNKG